MFLATTADQRFWKKEGKTLFLGEWCLTFDQKNIWSKLDHEILTYERNYRPNYLRDSDYLNQLYERLLSSYAQKLNLLHHEKYSVRYWRTIIGPWLYYFIQTLFDRYLSIRQVIDSGKVSLTWIPSFQETELVPKDFLTFQGWQPLDTYNLYLYSLLIKDLGGIPFEVQNSSSKLEQIPSQVGVDFFRNIKVSMKRLMEIYLRFIPQSLNEIVMVSLYMRKIDLCRFQISLGQLPCIYVPFISPSKVTPDFKLRKKLEVLNEVNEFESLLAKYIPRQMPTAYLESYSGLKNHAMRVFPKNPKVIIYVNSHFGNEGFKIWSADQMEKGTKLVGMPHGGHYGHELWSANEVHETKIADQYCTWGWSDKNYTNLVPLPSLQLAGFQKRIQCNPKGNILWIGTSIQRYLDNMMGVKVSFRILEYIEDQKGFLKNLSPEIKNILTMRLFHTDYRRGIREQLSEAIPNLNFDASKGTIFQELNKSRLCIATYNGTSILETLSANFPTLGFWNFDHWPLRETAQSYFEDLCKVGIVHKTPESAASKMNEIYKDPMSWWLSNEVQESKNKFCHQFARTSPNWLSEWKKEILRIAGE
jgi:putative transferase (TIGR04331 family)